MGRALIAIRSLPASSSARASPTRYTDPDTTTTPPAERSCAICSASRTDCAATAGVPVALAAASRSSKAAARAVWMGATITCSKIGNRICAISASGLSRRQLKMRVVRPVHLQNAAQTRPQRPCARRVMRHVQNPVHAAARHAFQPSWPTRVANSLFDRGRRYGKPVHAGKLDRGGNCQRHVALLVRAGQRRIHLDRRAKRLNGIGTPRTGGRNVGNRAHPAHAQSPPPPRPEPGLPPDAAAA